MKAPILLGILGAISKGSLQHLNNHHGHPFRASATYERHETRSPQPPFQMVENQSISKRRLDVWKPISSDPTPAPVKVKDIQPAVESTTASYWSPQYSTTAKSLLGESPQREYVQLTAGPTTTGNFAPKQILNVQSAPAINKPTQKVKLPSQVPELKRPRYPPTPKRPLPRLPVQPQKIFSPARAPVPKLRKPPILPGYPPRRGIFKQAQDRKDTGFLDRRPVLIAPSKKVKKKFLKPLSAPFTFSKPPLPLKEVLVIRNNEKEPRRAVERVDTAGFEDLLSHLDKFKEDDDYSPNNPTTKAPNRTPPSPPIKTAKPIRPTPPKPPKRPKPGKISDPPKPPKPTEQSDESEEEGGSDIKAPPPPTTAEVASRPIFPTIQLQRQDVLKALDAVDQSVAPLVHAATVISNSLQGVGSQSVEEVLNNERQDGEEPLDGVVETLEFTVQEILAKPEPLIILSAVLLSVITGSAIGNTITTMRSNGNRDDGTRFGGECPVGYEVVFIDEDGVMLRTGSVVNVRMKRETSENVVDPARRGYPFRKVTKQVVLDGGEDKEERHGGYYCKKIGDSVDTTGSKGAVGIRVNSEEHPDGGQGQVSIQVGGVSVTVGEANKLAREEVHLEMNEYEEESEEERDLGKTEDVEIVGVVDVFIDSLRQIRSLIVG